MQTLDHIPEQIKAIVFDFDGVLADTVPVKSSAFYDWVPARLHHLRPAFMEFHMGAYGIGRRQQVEYFFREIAREPATSEQIDAEVARLSEINRSRVFTAPLFRDTIPFLEHLSYARYIIGIASGTPQKELEELVRHHRLDAFCRHRVGTPTSKADALRRIMTVEGLSPEQVLFFGDANMDWTAAHTTGVTFVFRPSQVSFTASHAGWCVENFETISRRRLN